MDTRGFTAIQTPRLLLRRFRPEDAGPFFGYRTLPDVALYQGEGWLGFKPEDAEEFVSAQITSEPFVSDTWFQLAVERRDTGALAGDIGLFTPGDIRQAEIGFTVAPPYQKQGIAYEAVGYLLRYLFAGQGLHRVTAVADMRNLASIALLEKLGMRREGCFLKASWNKGAYVDEAAYAILEEEWKMRWGQP